MKNLNNYFLNLKTTAFFTKRHVFVVMFLFVIAFEIITFFKGHGASKVDLNKYADQVISVCANASYHPACYDKTIPELMDYISMEDAFKVTAIVQDRDKSYLYCHVLAHELSAREVDKDPTHWKDVVSRVPSGMCSNGGIHGAFQEKFRGETFTDLQLQMIKPEIKDLCEERDTWHPTGMEQASCYHALGHLTMYITSADIKRSLSLCDEFSAKLDGRDFKHVCYDGVFMQMFQPLENEDFNLIKGKEVAKDKLVEFCDQFTGQAKGSCWSEGWPLYRTELEKPEGLTKYCSHASPEERNRCFQALMYVVTAFFNLDSEKVFTYCTQLLDEQKGKCFASAAGRMIEVDYRNIQKAVDFCSSADKYDKEHQCFNALLQYSRYNYKVNSTEFYHVCDTLPAEWKDKCLKKI